LLLGQRWEQKPFLVSPQVTNSKYMFRRQFVSVRAAQMDRILKHLTMSAFFCLFN